MTRAGGGPSYIKFHGRLSPAIVFTEFDLRPEELENPETRVCVSTRSRCTYIYIYDTHGPFLRRIHTHTRVQLLLYALYKGV